MEAFANNGDSTAYEQLVDRLLSTPAYGERWGRHWLDVARFGESNGYEQNHLRETAWPYRSDWVIRSLNEDKPFNRMILEQLAGDRLAPDDPEVNAATGFLVAGPHDTVGIRNPEGEAQKRANHLDDMIMGTASAFLGLTVHCARCHDHKFDPIRTEDYYRMQAAFGGVWHGERTWDGPGRVRAYETASGPLSSAIEECEKGLADLRSGARERVEADRDPHPRPLPPKRRSGWHRGTIRSGQGAFRAVDDLKDHKGWEAGRSRRVLRLDAWERQPQRCAGHQGFGEINEEGVRKSGHVLPREPRRRQIRQALDLLGWPSRPGSRLSCRGSR